MPLYYPNLGMNITGNTAGNSAVVSSGTLYLSGGNNITLSQSTAAGGNTIVFSAAAGGGGGATMRGWYPYNQMGFNNTTTLGNGNLVLFPLFAPQYVTATAVQHIISNSLSSSSNSSFSYKFTMSVGLFNFTNSTQLSLLSSGSATYGFSMTSSSSSTAYNSLRYISIPINVNMSPGQYVVGLWSSTASTNANWMTVFHMINTSIFGAFNFSGSFGTQSGSTTQFFPGFGSYSTSFGSAMPSTIPINAIVGSANAAYRYLHLQFPNF